MMTGREKLFKALRGEPLPTPPYWLLFPYHPLGCYVDVRNHPDYRAIHELAMQSGITLDRRHLGCDMFAGGGKFEAKIRTDEELDHLLTLPVLTDRREIHRQLDLQLADYLRERDEFPAEQGAMMLDLGEPVNFIYHSCDLESLAIWSITDPEKIKSFLDRNFERIRIIYEYTLERDLAEVYFLVGSELASPPMFSVETFRSWAVPYARELIGMIHRHGAFAIQHYHGAIRQILPYFLEMGADALHTIESPPIGNCTIEEAFDIVGDRITLIGNVQYDDFRSCTPEQMAEQVRALQKKVSGKRFILSPSAGPFDPDPGPRFFENYRSFIQQATTTEKQESSYESR